METTRNISIPLQQTARKNTESKFLLYACIFLVGAFVGVIVETTWGLIKLQTLERRSGLLFFPMFNPVYGIGAVALTMIKGKEPVGNGKIFLRAAVSGAVVEYLMSWFQETVTGSVSWDYKAMPLNIGGRINLLYCIAWGLLGLLWIRKILPHVEHMVRKMDSSLFRKIMTILILLIGIDLACATVTLVRWSTRTQGVPASTAIGHMIDERYPDSRMKRYYPNLKFVK